MARTTVSLADVGVGELDLHGNKDLTEAVRKADQLCAKYNVQTLVLPAKAQILVDPANLIGGFTIFQAQHAHRWIGDRLTTEFVTKPLPATAQNKNGNSPFYLLQTPDAWDDVELEFAVNLQAALQPVDDSAASRSGYAAGGVRVNGANAKVACRVRNGRSNSATGFGSVFGIQILGPGAEVWAEFATDDGSTGSEGLVFQGLSDQGGDPWLVTHLRSDRMWRGMGCFSGHNGEVRDAVCTNLTGPADNKAPGNRIKGNAFNIEAGGLNGHHPTRHVKLVNPRTQNCDQAIVCTNNYGEAVEYLEVVGHQSVNDGYGLVFGGEGVADKVTLTDCVWDTPATSILKATVAQAANLDIIGGQFKGRAPLGVTAHRDWQVAPYTSPVSVTSVGPARIYRGMGTRVWIKGTHFSPNATVRISGERVTLTVVQRVDSTAILVKAAVGPRATYGPRTVTVTNPDGSSATGTLTIASP